MTTVSVNVAGIDYVLSDEHPASSGGVPVLVHPDGRTFAPWDNVIDNKDARMSGGERYRNQVTARAIAGYIKDDNPDNVTALDLLQRFNAVPNPELTA